DIASRSDGDNLPRGLPAPPGESHDRHGPAAGPPRAAPGKHPRALGAPDRRHFLDAASGPLRRPPDSDPADPVLPPLPGARVLSLPREVDRPTRRPDGVAAVAARRDVAVRHPGRDDRGLRLLVLQAPGPIQSTDA